MHSGSTCLVECGDTLLILRRFIRLMGSSANDDVFANTQTARIDVLDAYLHSDPCQWRRVNELGGHVVFVVQHSSKSLPARECSRPRGPYLLRN